MLITATIALCMCVTPALMALINALVFVSVIGGGRSASSSSPTSGSLAGSASTSHPPIQLSVLLFDTCHSFYSYSVTYRNQNSSAQTDSNLPIISSQQLKGVLLRLLHQLLVLWLDQLQLLLRPIRLIHPSTILFIVRYVLQFTVTV